MFLSSAFVSISNELNLLVIASSYTRVIQEPSDGKKLIKVKVKFFLSATFRHFSPAQIIQNTAQKSDDGIF